MIDIPIIAGLIVAYIIYLQDKEEDESQSFDDDNDMSY